MNEITDEIDNATSMHTNSITHGLCERPFSDRLNWQQIFGQTDKVYSKQETHAIKLLDNVGFIIRCSSNDNASISRLGVLYQNLGIKHEHYRCLLTSIHETFEHYLPNNIRQKLNSI
eukprot:497163_1